MLSTTMGPSEGLADAVSTPGSMFSVSTTLGKSMVRSSKTPYSVELIVSLYSSGGSFSVARGFQNPEKLGGS